MGICFCSSLVLLWFESVNSICVEVLISKGSFNEVGLQGDPKVTTLFQM